MKTDLTLKTPFIERFLALIGLFFLSPLLLAHMSRQYVKGNPVFVHKRYLADWNRVFVGRSLRERGTLSRAPLLWNVVKGDMRIVGNRLLNTWERDSSKAAPNHFTAEPGIFSLFELRRISGLEFIDEVDCNEEFRANQGAKARLAIVVKSLLAGMLYGSTRELIEATRFSIFGVEIENVTMESALSYIMNAVELKFRKTVFFANAHTLNLAYSDSDFRNLLNNSGCVLPDGSGIEVACRRAGVRRKGNVNGTDMLPLLCERLAQSGKTVFMLGGEEGIADSAMKNMQQRYPKLVSAGAHHGYFDQMNGSDLIAEINRSGADIVLVGMGQPLQEQWVSANRDALEASVVMAVGGLFDFYAGKVSRAPLWLRELGMEWSWRLLQEPGRMWRRYILGNPLFMLRLRNTY